MLLSNTIYNTFAQYLNIEPKYRDTFVRFCSDLEQITNRDFVQSFLTTSVIRKQYWLDRLAKESDTIDIDITDKLHRRENNTEIDKKNVYVFDLQAAIVQILYKPGTIYESMLLDFDINPSSERVNTVKTLLAKIGTGIILEGKQRAIVSLIAKDVYAYLHNTDKTFDIITINDYIKILNNDQFILLSDIDVNQLCLQLISFDYAFYIVRLV